MRSLLAAAVVALTTAGFAHACSCIAPPPPEKARDQAAAVFSGKVLKTETVNNQLRVTFEVARTWKGPSERQLVVTTATNGAACGVSFKAKESYLVYCFSTKADGALSTNLCTRTTTLKNAKADLKALGEGKEPAGDS